jgi:hypothetical protein
MVPAQQLKKPVKISPATFTGKNPPFTGKNTPPAKLLLGDFRAQPTFEPTNQ